MKKGLLIIIVLALISVAIFATISFAKWIVPQEEAKTQDSDISTSQADALLEGYPTKDMAQKSNNNTSSFKKNELSSDTEPQNSSQYCNMVADLFGTQ